MLIVILLLLNTFPGRFQPICFCKMGPYNCVTPTWQNYHFSTVCLPYIFIFLQLSLPTQYDQNKLSLVSQFQHTIVCHQWTKIDGAREDWPGQSLDVLGKILVICSKIEIFRDSIYFIFNPRRAFLLKFYPISSAVCPMGLKGPVICGLFIFEKNIR